MSPATAACPALSLAPHADLRLVLISLGMTSAHLHGHAPRVQSVATKCQTCWMRAVPEDQRSMRAANGQSLSCVPARHPSPMPILSAGGSSFGGVPHSICPRLRWCHDATQAGSWAARGRFLSRRWRNLPVLQCAETAPHHNRQSPESNSQSGEGSRSSSGFGGGGGLPGFALHESFPNRMQRLHGQSPLGTS